MKKIISFGVVALLLPSVGNANVDTAISTANTLLEGGETYRQLENEVNAYKQNGSDYANETESDISAAFASAVEQAASEDEMKYVLRKIQKKEPFGLDDGRWFDSFLWRVESNWKTNQIPAYTEDFKTFSENFCKTQVAHEGKINALIDQTDTLSVSSQIKKAARGVNGWSNSSTDAKWKGLMTKATAFTKFDQKYGCAKYKGKAMWNGQSEDVSQNVLFIKSQKEAQLKGAQNSLRNFMTSKSGKRGMSASLFKLTMRNLLGK